MRSLRLREALTLLLPLGCDGLKISPPRWLVTGRQESIHKRQAADSSSASSTTTLNSQNPFLPASASQCVCRLIAPFDQYNTITSTYYATNTDNGLSTTTLVAASGTTPGTVEVFTPVPYGTTTITSGSTPFTSLESTTATDGSPSSIVVVDVPVQLCGNQGWQWAYGPIPAYDHAFYNDFDYSTMQCTINYTYQGTTSEIYIPEGQAHPEEPPPVPGYEYDFYGQYTNVIAPAVVNHRAFFIAPYAGTYTFTITNADDEAALWLGADAVENYNNNNYLIEYSTYTNRTAGGFPGVPQNTYSFNTGDCTPIRVGWADGSSPGGLSISITAPDGSVMDGTNYIRDTCCNPTVTYKPFGSECATPPNFPTTTIYSNGPAYTSTVYTSTISGNPAEIIVINEPPYATTTYVGGTSASTVISTTIVNGSPTPVVVVNEPLCGNQGWQWGYASIALAEYSNNNNFDYSQLQTAQYKYIGTASYIGVTGTPYDGAPAPYQGPMITYYGEYTDYEGGAATNQRAFFIAPISGTYTLAITDVDDEVGIWIGNSAIRGYNNNNEFLESDYSLGPASATLTLNQYDCTPVRVLWADGSSPGSFNITITGPDGTQYQNSNYIRDTCCGNPYTFSAFGNES